jgi:hypothetical protein
LTLSAGGTHVDVASGLVAACGGLLEPIQVLTNREASPLTQSATSLTDITLHPFPLVEKDGFLATNSLLLNAVLIARAHGELSGNAAPFPSAMNELWISHDSVTACAAKLSPLAQEAVKRLGLLIVYSPHLRAVAADLSNGCATRPNTLRSISAPELIFGRAPTDIERNKALKLFLLDPSR